MLPMMLMGATMAQSAIQQVAQHKADSEQSAAAAKQQLLTTKMEGERARTNMVMKMSDSAGADAITGANKRQDALSDAASA